MLRYTFYTISTAVFTYALLVSKYTAHYAVQQSSASRPTTPPPPHAIATATTARPWQSDSVLKPQLIRQTNYRRRSRLVRHIGHFTLSSTCRAQSSRLPNLASPSGSGVRQSFRLLRTNYDGRFRRQQANAGCSTDRRTILRALKSANDFLEALQSALGSFCSPKCEPLFRQLPKCNEPAILSVNSTDQADPIQWPHDRLWHRPDERSKHLWPRCHSFQSPYSPVIIIDITSVMIDHG